LSLCRCQTTPLEQSSHTQRDHSQFAGGIAVQFAVNVGGPKRSRLTDQSADLDVAEHRRITKIQGLENPEIWFFAKMAWKTTSGSVFHFILNSASRISSKGHKYR